ncbi:MAG: GNAT family N-acetyltransferase [Bacteroidota bacterium]
MKVQFKKCELEDIPQLIKISTQSYREHYPYLWEDKGESYIANNFNEAVFKQELLQASSEFYLVLLQEEAVGFFKINKIDGIHLELERIYLITTAKGRGLGKAAIHFVEGLAIKYNKSIIFLKTMQKGKAYLFYEKCGFQIVDTDSLNDPLAKETYKEMFVMEKVLKKTN